MEWTATTEDASQSAASISRAFEVLRKIPPRPVTKRLSKLALRKAKGISQYEETESDEEAGEQHGTITGRITDEPVFRVQPRPPTPTHVHQLDAWCH